MTQKAYIQYACFIEKFYCEGRAPLPKESVRLFLACKVEKLHPNAIRLLYGDPNVVHILFFKTALQNINGFLQLFLKIRRIMSLCLVYEKRSDSIGWASAGILRSSGRTLRRICTEEVVCVAAIAVVRNIIRSEAPHDILPHSFVNPKRYFGNCVFLVHEIENRIIFPGFLCVGLREPNV